MLRSVFVQIGLLQGWVCKSRWGRVRPSRVKCMQREQRRKYRYYRRRRHSNCAFQQAKHGTRRQQGEQKQINSGGGSAEEQQTEKRMKGWKEMKGRVVKTEIWIEFQLVCGGLVLEPPPRHWDHSLCLIDMVKEEEEEADDDDDGDTKHMRARKRTTRTSGKRAIKQLGFTHLH